MESGAEDRVLVITIDCANTNMTITSTTLIPYPDGALCKLS